MQIEMAKQKLEKMKQKAVDVSTFNLIDTLQHVLTEDTTPEIFLGHVINSYSRLLPHRLTRFMGLIHSLTTHGVPMWMGIEEGFGAKAFTICTDDEKLTGILDCIDIDLDEEIWAKGREQIRLAQLKAQR